MQNKPETYLHAGFFVRLAAFLLDSIIVGAVLLIVRIPFWISGIYNPNNIFVRDIIFSYSVVDIVTYLLSVGYFVVLTYKTGATVGKKMLHLRVVSVEDRKPTLFEIVYRESIGRFLSGLIANVGYIMIGIHKEKHGLHDMLSDTEVIYFHEKKVYVNLQEQEQKVSEATDYAAARYEMEDNAIESEKTVESDEVSIDEEVNNSDME